MDWVSQMYVAAVVGSIFGVFWPYIVRLFKDVAPVAYIFDVPGPGKFVVWLVVGAIIGAVVAALGFATFLGDAATQTALKAQGFVAFFAAFAYGFAGGSFFEEPLKKN